MEIEHRVGLYQVFLKLYEHNRSLLDEILQLENTKNQSSTRFSPRYVIGVVGEEQVYLLTNLLKGKTQKVVQPEKIWTIGRARNLAFTIFDERLSRHHAAIKYVENQGFSLLDLDSTNGTFVNNEPVHEPILLKEGDRLRLGSVVFSFFLCTEEKALNSVPPEVLEKLSDITLGKKAQSSMAEEDKETDLFLQQKLRSLNHGIVESPKSTAEEGKLKLTPKQRADVLDRFLNRHKNN